MSDVVDLEGLKDTFSLINELQQSLYQIARSAEMSDEKYLPQIMAEAELALRLIDTYRQCASVQLGQTTMQFGNQGVGSILHDSAMDVRKYIDCDTSVINKSHGPVATDPSILKNLLFSLGYFIAKSGGKQLVFRSFRDNENSIEIGVIAKNFYITKPELDNAFKNKTSHMPLSRISPGGIVLLSLADNLANILGTQISVKKSLHLRGFCITLPKSEQLRLV